MRSEFLSKRFRIFILGAGFSRPAGLPLASELWEEVLRRARGMSGRASFFVDDLNEYIEFRRRCYGDTLDPNQVDFEDFMAFLDVEHYLGLRGKDTWSTDGNEGQVVVKTLIGEILTERTPARDEIPELYLKFARLLQPTDIVLTFNYDVLLERALESIRLPFRLFPSRLGSVDDSRDFASVDMTKEELVLLKLHGSVDWFDRSFYSTLDANFLQQGSSHHPTHPVFNPSSPLNIAPLIDGPCFKNDPLRQMYRVLDIEKLYDKGILFHATPSLLNPSSVKILYSKMLRDFWWGLGASGILNFGMVIIGFSMPQQDDYARQVLYRPVTNYQENYWEHGELNHKKTPLLLIDFRTSPEHQQQYRHRYAFVDWSRAQLHFGGLDDEALSLIRAT
ncbi:MAG: SIR2 family protein [Candidatus Acidiferrales bacterium]